MERYKKYFKEEHKKLNLMQLSKYSDDEIFDEISYYDNMIDANPDNKDQISKNINLLNKELNKRGFK